MDFVDFELGTEQGAVLVDSHDLVGARLLEVASYGSQMAAFGFRASELEVWWERWPLVVFAEQASC